MLVAKGGRLPCAVQEGRRSESFTFAPVSPERHGSRIQGIVRATASEPCEVLDFSRLGSQQAGHLRHGVSLPPLEARFFILTCCKAGDATRTVQSVQPALSKTHADDWCELLQGVTSVEGLPHGLALPPATLSCAHGQLDTALSTGEWDTPSEHHKLAQVAAAPQHDSPPGHVPLLAYMPFTQSNDLQCAAYVGAGRAHAEWHSACGRHGPAAGAAGRQ